jgi:hypothetical protein
MAVFVRILLQCVGRLVSIYIITDSIIGRKFNWERGIRGGLQGLPSRWTADSC